VSDRHFEIFKIVLDKGLLAIVVAIAGLIFSIILERYKSILKRQEELSKLIAPGVVQLQTQSQSLFDAGIRALDVLDEQFAHFHHWRDAIFDSNPEYYEPHRFIEPNVPNGPEFLDRKIKCSTLGTSTIRELLDRTADDMVKEAIKSENFPSSEAHKAVGGFFYALHLNILAPLTSRDDRLRSALLLGVIQSVFIPFTSHLRNVYYREIQSFTLAVMRQAPEGTRKQDRAIDHIAECTENMAKFVKDYPTLDTFQSVGPDDRVINFDTRSTLLEGHAAILTQLHDLLRS
jgi:hypothetical protein